MTEDVRRRLDQLIGEPKMYAGKELTITDYKDVKETIVIYTKGRTYTFLPSEIEDFFRDLKDVKEVKSFLPDLGTSKPMADETPGAMMVSVNGYQPTAENQSLKTSLMDMLKKVNDNPKDAIVIQQAKTVCELANTMVNIQKAEIQMINAVKRK